METMDSRIVTRLKSSGVSPLRGRKSAVLITRWRRSHNPRQQEEPESVETSRRYKAYQGKRWYY